MDGAEANFSAITANNRCTETANTSKHRVQGEVVLHIDDKQNGHENRGQAKNQPCAQMAYCTLRIQDGGQASPGPAPHVRQRDRHQSRL